MSDIWSNNPLASFFFAGKDDKNVPQALRQKIALAMLMQKRAHPKTFGEGLSAIGDAIGERRIMNQVEGDAATAEGVANKAYESLRAPVAATDPGDVDPEVVPVMRPPSQVVAPPPPPPAALATPPAAPAVPLPPDQQQSDVPGAPLRMPTPAAVQDWRNQNPPPANIPRPPGAPPPATRSMAPPPLPPSAPATPGNEFNDRFGASKPGQQSALPGAPVMAMGGDDAEGVIGPQRNAIAMAMQPAALGGPQPNPTPVVAAGSPDQGIRPAPPPPQVKLAQAAPQPAPVQPSAEPGYVLDLPPAPRPPPTMSPAMQKIQNVIQNTPPAYRDAVQAKLAPVYQQEQAVLAQQHEAYKDQLIQHRALELKRHEQLAAQRASQDAAASAELARREATQRIRKGEEPVLREDVESKHIYNPETGQYEAPKIAGQDPDKKPVFKGTEFQGKALVNYGRARIAQEGLTPEAEKVLANSPLQAALSGFTLPVVGKVGATWRDDAYKEADTHSENFVQAFIRQQSGGAFTDPELEKEARSMLPKYGDTEKQLTSKREQREQFLSGMYSVIGTSGQKGADIDARQREADRERRNQEKPPAAQKYEEGDEAVWPDKSIRVFRNGKWVRK